jgi:hypothetical protein
MAAEEQIDGGDGGGDDGDDKRQNFLYWVYFDCVHSSYDVYHYHGPHYQKGRMTEERNADTKEPRKTFE